MNTPVAAAVSAEIDAAVSTAVEGAEARAEAAEAVNAAITEAALRDAISARVDDLQEDILSCQESLQESLQECRVSLSQMTAMQERLTILETKMATPVVVVPEPLIQQALPARVTTETTTQVVNPSSAEGDGLPAAATPAKQPRFRLT